MDGLIYFQQNIINSIETKQALLRDEAALSGILKASELCLAAYRRGNKVMIAGNGGSAADSQHIAAEFVSRFEFDRPGLPALALTTDTSILTAIGNDYGFEKLFARQIQANAQVGDIFIGISTSGNSKNILAAMIQAKSMGLTTVGLAGSGGIIADYCDICIRVPSSHTPRIQESHILIGHMICGYVEQEYFSDRA
ncbi:MAG: SIS domain-containing protein [Vibrio sp.]|uniref:D-sedoheptulose-7-phosphate isomerase n=1 Tax=Vibrio sp. TaxID=678 RepID=UPI003A861C59